MNTGLIKIAFAIMVLTEFVCCTLTPDSELNAYLYNVNDSYPQIISANDSDSILDRRILKYYFLLKNDTKETYWLKLRKYSSNSEDTISHISFSVKSKNKRIDINPYSQNQSFIFQKKGDEYDYNNHLLSPGDSASIIIDIPEYTLDSLGIARMTSAIEITKKIVFVSHQRINDYLDYKIPHINLIMSNQDGKMCCFDEIIDKQNSLYKEYKDSISNIIYTFPLYWKAPIYYYRIIEQ